jgi:proteasome lid subunit RPN8/RPN11
MLILPNDCLSEIQGHAERGYPDEVCGLLIGTREGEGEGEHATVIACVAGRNVRTERTRTTYELDPRSFLEAERAAEARGCEVIGVYHSHPDHPAQASPTDRDAAWPGLHYLIVAIRNGRLEDQASFVLRDGEMRSEGLTMTMMKESLS